MSDSALKAFTELGFPVAVTLALFVFIWKAGTWVGKHFVLEVVSAVKLFLASLTKHNDSIEKITSSLSSQMDSNTQWLKKTAEASELSCGILKSLNEKHDDDDSKFSTVKTNKKLQVIEEKIDDLKFPIGRISKIK
jgi:formyltetrahydrofolate synthetase